MSVGIADPIPEFAEFLAFKNCSEV